MIKHLLLLWQMQALCTMGKKVKEATMTGWDVAIQKGVQQGMQQGKQAFALEAAKRMLAKNLSVEMVAEITGISAEELRLWESNKK